jgi:hypothetical protein
MSTVIKLIVLSTVLIISVHAPGQTNSGVLRLLEDTAKDDYAYVNSNGDTVIPFGKYLICYTKKFDKFAIVKSLEKGIIGIDRNENVLFNVYEFDNGPDYPSNGLFRITENGKIGYADMKGNIIVPPQFDCAYPFKNGKAKVGKGCKRQTDGEHSWWTDGTWYTINKKGNIVKP